MYDLPVDGELRIITDSTSGPQVARQEVPAPNPISKPSKQFIFVFCFSTMQMKATLLWWQNIWDTRHDYRAKCDGWLFLGRMARSVWDEIQARLAIKSFA